MTATLSEICKRKREHIALQKKNISESTLIGLARAQEKPRGFRRALAAKKPALIAEIKKASPSKGLIRADFDVAAIARAYEAGGAACLSVLTDEPYFQGADENIKLAKDAASLPVLRKDFMLDPYQITESRSLGADSVLLIMAALSDSQAAELEAEALALGMDVLIEVHDEAELSRALSNLKSQMIGINNRNLKTMQVDLSTSEKLAKEMPPHILAVSESGIGTNADIQRMNKMGIHAFLVGESLMRESDVAFATRKLLGI